MADLICAYARLTYEALSRNGEIDYDQEAPDHLQTLLAEVRRFVPESHWDYLEYV